MILINLYTPANNVHQTDFVLYHIKVKYQVEYKNIWGR